jgi:hypothetical protein
MPGSNSVDCLTDLAEIFLLFLFEAAISLRLRMIFELRCVVSELRHRTPALENAAVWLVGLRLRGGLASIFFFVLIQKRNKKNQGYE